MVSGVTEKQRQEERGRRRLNAARKTRSAGWYAGRLTWRLMACLHYEYPRGYIGRDGAGPWSLPVPIHE